MTHIDATMQTEKQVIDLSEDSSGFNIDLDCYFGKCSIHHSNHLLNLTFRFEAGLVSTNIGDEEELSVINREEYNLNKSLELSIT